MKRAYLYLYFDPARAVKDEHEFADLLGRLHHELSSGTLTSDHERLYQRYFRKVRGGWSGRHTVIEAERAHHGYFALLSNDASLTCWDTLDTYRQKDDIEKAFHDVKDRLDLRTPRMHTHETLTGKLVAVFTALILTTELRVRHMTANLPTNQTIQAILDNLETIEQYHQPGHRPRTLHITNNQHTLYTTLGVTPPTSQHTRETRMHDAMNYLPLSHCSARAASRSGGSGEPLMADA